MSKKGSGPNFSKATVDKLAKEAGYICSNPDCRKRTTLGPTDKGAISLGGEAAHIRSANPGKARYDPSQTDQERAAIENGIYLCIECHRTRVDVDVKRYPTKLLHEWKVLHSQYLASGKDNEERKAGQLVLRNIEDVLPMWRRESEAKCIGFFFFCRLSDEVVKKISHKILIPEIVETAIEAASTSELGNKARVILIAGEAGSGKSMCLEKVFQNSIIQFKSLSESRVPIMIRGLRENTSLEQAIKEQIRLLGIEHPNRALICIDKLDELEPRTLRTVLNTANELTRIHDYVILYATRPIFEELPSASQIELPLLCSEDTLRVASYSAEREVHDYELSHQSDATKELLKRPLFSLLFGLWLRNSPQHANTSGTRLLSFTG